MYVPTTVNNEINIWLKHLMNISYHKLFHFVLTLMCHVVFIVKNHRSNVTITLLPVFDYDRWI